MMTQRLFQAAVGCEGWTAWTNSVSRPIAMDEQSNKGTSVLLLDPEPLLWQLWLLQSVESSFWVPEAGRNWNEGDYVCWWGVPFLPVPAASLPHWALEMRCCAAREPSTQGWIKPTLLTLQGIHPTPCWHPRQGFTSSANKDSWKVGKLINNCSLVAAICVKWGGGERGRKMKIS